MPKRSKRRKGKKGKRKKGGKKKIIPDGPPLHLLTQLYNKLEEKVEDLYELRLIQRKKRLMACYASREMDYIEGDNFVYHQYLQENIEALEDLIEKIKAEIEAEKASIQAEIDRRIRELKRRQAELLNRIPEIEVQIEKLLPEMRKLDPFFAQVAAIQAQIDELKNVFIPQALREADIKARNLKNQFLEERAKMYFHMDTLLCELVSKCRSLLLPILWNHLKSLKDQNSCKRYKLAIADELNQALDEKRDELIEERDRLVVERPYNDYTWCFKKRAEKAAKVKKERILVIEKKSRADTAESKPPITQLSIDFTAYLQKRLNSIKSSQNRAENEKKEMDAVVRKAWAVKQLICRKRNVPIRACQKEFEDDLKLLAKLKKVPKVEEEEEDDEEEWESESSTSSYVSELTISSPSTSDSDIGFRRSRESIMSKESQSNEGSQVWGEGKKEKKGKEKRKSKGDKKSSRDEDQLERDLIDEEGLEYNVEE